MANDKDLYDNKHEIAGLINLGNYEKCFQDNSYLMWLLYFQVFAQLIAKCRALNL